MSDKATALKLIDNAMQDAYDKINRGISLGRVAPGAVQRSLQSVQPQAPAGVMQWERGPNGMPRPAQ